MVTKQSVPHPDHPTYRGVRVPTKVAQALQSTQADVDQYTIGWKDGVDAHYARSVELAAERRDPAEIQAFTAVANGDNVGTARQIIRDMSPRDRAVLQYVLRTVSRITEEEDGFAEDRDRRRAREDVLAFE